MNNTKKHLILCLLLFGSLAAQAQLLDSLKKKKKNRKETPTEQVEDRKPTETVPNKTFTYRCFSLNRDIEKEHIDSCLLQFARKVLTEMEYYEEGEDVQYMEKNSAYVTLSFLDDTKKLIAIKIEDIRDMNLVMQLQQAIFNQMGEPTQGYELMKNYDGSKSSIWTDYSVYEFVYQYKIGANTYDFRITQFGANVQNGKVIHPYTFSAVVNQDSNMPYNAVVKTDGEKEKTEKAAFYPTEGIAQFTGFVVESKLLRKW